MRSASRATCCVAAPSCIASSIAGCSRDILMFAGGGLAILHAIERVGFDVFNRRPKLTKFDYLKLGWNALRGRLPN